MGSSAAACLSQEMRMESYLKDTKRKCRKMMAIVLPV